MVQTTTTKLTTKQQQQSDQAEMEQDTSKTIGGKAKPSYKHIPHSQKPPHLVAKRNARERRRVQAVNQAFYKLRKSVPIENRNKRVSKVKTLQRAIDYIRRLERILAEDDEAQTAGAIAAANSNQVNRNHQEAQPLQQANCNQLNSSSSGRNEDEKVVAMGRDSNDNSDRLKRSPTRKGPLSLTGKRVQQKANNITTETEAASQRRNRKQTQLVSKSKQLTDKLQEAYQVARAQQKHAHGVPGPHPQQEDNNYTATRLKSTTNVSNGGCDLTAAGIITPGQCCATTGAVSYGKPHDSITTTALAANRLACVQPPPLSNHHYQYYIDSPTSSSMMANSSRTEQPDQFAYNNYNHHHHHPQLPSNQIQNVGQQQRACLSGEISSSSMMTNGPNLCGNYLSGTSYQYAAASPMDQASHCQVDTNSHQHYQRLVNHNDSYLKPVDSPTTTTSHQQRYFPPPLAHHYQTTAQNTWSLQQESVRETIESLNDCSKKTKLVSLSLDSHQQASDKEQVSELTSSDSLRRKQADYERTGGLIGVTAAQSMPADSTSCPLSAQKDLTNRPSALNGIRSPAVSICSSSSLSPSTTTLKSLDLSGNSGSGSSTVGTVFTGSNINRNDKSPTTSAPVVCRQPNKSNLENGAHSTTARDYMPQQRVPGESTNGQQQVNNYDPTYAAHLSYEAHSSNSAAVDYLRSGGHQLRQQLQERPTDEQREIQTKLTGNALRNGSRSSSAISPDPTTTTAQQLALVGGNYLANNNLHGTDQQQHSVQLFQYQPATYYNQQHLHQHHEHHHHQQHQHQQSLYQQGQHFLGNHHGHQQHNSNHLSDHHHHLQSDSAGPTSELHQQNANTIELVTTTDINNSHHQQLERLMTNNSTTTITTAPAQFTALPL